MPPHKVHFQHAPGTSAVPPSQPVFQGQSEQQSPVPRHPSSPPSPLLRLHLDDLSHEATAAFLSAVNPTTLLKDATATVMKWLYDVHEHHTLGPIASSAASPDPWPPVRSVTLVVRPNSGVAYTTSIRIDEDHKEIHLSLGYVSHAAESDRLHEEMIGVIVHEMVHVWQSYADGSVPGGLTEGIADWVRLKAGLAPPHWKREAGGDGQDWDSGYATTAWFLDWLEEVRVGKGTVRKCNQMLRNEKYDEKTFWHELCGEKVEVLWKEYGKWLEKEKEKG